MIMQTMMQATMLVQAMGDGGAHDNFTTTLNYNFELVRRKMCCKNVVKLKAYNISYESSIQCFPHCNGMNST
jgi:hypothetical protein